jgi:dihydromethanopterin reductase
MAVNLIAAIGNSGQLGLKGTLPWHNPVDLALFKEKTHECSVIVGVNTFKHMPLLRHRYVYIYTKATTPEKMIERHTFEFPDREIWIAGGAEVYRIFAPFVDGLRVFSHINYDGPADKYFPFDAYGIEWRGQDLK